MMSPDSTPLDNQILKMNTLKIGDKAPEFTLRATDKSEVSLSDYAGKNVVLLFFHLAFTNVCTDELCYLRDSREKYEKISGDVIAISVDSLFTLEKFKSEQKYHFPMLSDWNKEVSALYGTLHEEFAFGMRGVSKRSAFVIDSDGIIRYAEVLENAGQLPNFGAIERTLQALK